MNFEFKLSLMIATILVFISLLYRFTPEKHKIKLLFALTAIIFILAVAQYI